jgi:hypothetical protein
MLLVRINKFDPNIILVNINKLKPYWFVENSTLQPILAKTNDLLLEEPIEIGRPHNMFTNELVEKDTNDLLVKELVGEKLDVLITTQLNDMAVHLVIIINVILVDLFCPKGHVVFKKPPTLTLWL